MVHFPKFFVSFQYLAQKWVHEKQVRSVNVTDVPNCLHFSLKTVVGYLKTKIKLDVFPSIYNIIKRYLSFLLPRLMSLYFYSNANFHHRTRFVGLFIH